MEELHLNSKILQQIMVRTMPFGKYQGVKLLDIPVSYLEWMNKKGWPGGTLGKELALVYEIKMNGLMELLQPLRKKSEG